LLNKNVVLTIGVLMTSINTTSLHQFSSQFHRYSSNSISDKYKENLYLARIAREDRRSSTQNSIENVVETTREEQNVSNISDEVNFSQTAQYTTPKPSMSIYALKTNSSENNQSYDNTINQLKAQKNSLQQELNRLNQKGRNQATYPNHEGDRGITQDVETTVLPANRLMKEEAPLANVLKQQIDEMEQEINKNRNKSNIGVNFDPTNGLSLSQLRQKKTRLEQQLRNLEVEVSKLCNWTQDNNRPATKETVEEHENFSYQNHMEKLRIKKKIRNLESEINVLERKRIVHKIQAALNETGNVSNETTNAENHLLDIEV